MHLSLWGKVGVCIYLHQEVWVTEWEWVECRLVWEEWLLVCIIQTLSNHLNKQYLLMVKRMVLAMLVVEVAMSQVGEEEVEGASDKHLLVMPHKQQGLSHLVVGMLDMEVQVRVVMQVRAVRQGDMVRAIMVSLYLNK